MERATERTRLLEQKQPPYAFDSSLARERKRRVKQFQCCLCALFVTIFLVALVVTVSYSIANPPSDDTENTATTSSLSDNTTFNGQSAIISLFNRYPLEDHRLNKTTSTDERKWNKAIEAGTAALLERDNIEKNAPSLPLDSPSFRHQTVMATNLKARNFGRKGYRNIYAAKHMRENMGTSSLLLVCKEENNDISPFCTISNRTCNYFKKYRYYNGTCNNFKYPHTFGVAYQPFRRALPPDYSDGVNLPRASNTGQPLPSARTISIEVHRPYYRTDPKFTVMLAVWGQFLDHDMTATALSQKSNGSSIGCCETTILSPECFPVILDPDDPISEYNITCMEFVRSAPAHTCCLGPREQMNQVTSFIDGSVIYGSDNEKVISLRQMSNGLLKMYKSDDARELLPVSTDLGDGCNREEESQKGRYCFMTGDARANENLHLTSMHLLWARHHNILAKNMLKLNPHWNDEIIFQESRRIVAAEMQHITYNEFLPILLGDVLMKRFDLSPKESGYSGTYNESIDPSIANNFAGSAFRFAHTLIPGLMKLLANDTSSPEFIQMHKILFDPFKLYVPGELDKVLRGAMNTSLEASDSYFSEEVVSHLFEGKKEQPQRMLNKLDLVSLNIQRGRDHGLPGYVHWREHCGLSKPNNFQDLKPFMDPEPFYNIKSVYRNVEDIDLYTGGVSERPVEGGFLGPTFTCLILDQFIRVKKGDRFWYENSEKPQAFTPDQLQEIRKTTLAKIICETSDNVDVIQPKVMERVDEGNEYTPCRMLAYPNLDVWRDNLEKLNIPSQSLKVVNPIAT